LPFHRKGKTCGTATAYTIAATLASVGAATADPVPLTAYADRGLLRRRDIGRKSAELI
jgi:hypothetical protein